MVKTVHSVVAKDELVDADADAGLFAVGTVPVAVRRRAAVAALDAQSEPVPAPIEGVARHHRSLHVLALALVGARPGAAEPLRERIPLRSTENREPQPNLHSRSLSARSAPRAQRYLAPIGGARNSAPSSQDVQSRRFGASDQRGLRVLEKQPSLIPLEKPELLVLDRPEAARSRVALGDLQLRVRPSRSRQLIARIRIPAPSLSPVRQLGSPQKRTRADRGSPPTEDEAEPASAVLGSNLHGGSAAARRPSAQRALAGAALRAEMAGQAVAACASSAGDDEPSLSQGWQRPPRKRAPLTFADLGQAAEQPPSPSVRVDAVDAPSDLCRQPFSPPVVPISARRVRRDEMAAEPRWPKLGGSSSGGVLESLASTAHAHPDAPDGALLPRGCSSSGPISLRYDAVLACYFDPASLKYYEMR